MTGNVTLTAALRSNLLALKGHQKTLDQTQLRLATGKKINSALDNANSFYTSRALSFRASDLSQLTDGMAQSIQVLKAADHGITALAALVRQNEAIVQNASETLGKNSTALFLSGDIPAGITLPGIGAMVVGAVTSSFLVTLGGNTLQQAANGLNAYVGTGNVRIRAEVVPGTLPNTERLALSSDNGNELIILPGIAATWMNANQAGAGGSAGTTHLGTAYTIGTSITPSALAIEMAKLQQQLVQNNRQIDLLIQDTGYRGTNLLRNDTLQTAFNESNSSMQIVSGVNFNTQGLGLRTNRLYTQAEARLTINEMRAALNTLRAQAKVFGTSLTVIQNRLDYTNNLINHLKEGADQLTLADKNEEGANLLSTQTSQQMSITALSLASQASQAVLRLFSS